MNKMVSFVKQLLITTVLLCSLHLHAVEKEDTVVYFALNDYYPLTFQLPDGTPSGLYVEFIELLSKQTNIPIEIKFVDANEFANYINSDANYIFSFFRTAEREKILNFTVPMHAVQTGVVYNKQFSVDTRFDEFSKLRIAVMAGTQQETYLRVNYPQHTIMTFRTTEDGVNLLYNDQVDAIVGELPTIKHVLSRSGLIGIYPVSDEILYIDTVHLAIAKQNRQLYEALNEGINQLSVNTVTALERKWSPALEPYFSKRTVLDSLTNSEKEWLNQHQTISVGIDDNLPPYEILNENGDYVGIAPDYLSFASEKLGIRFSPRTDLTWLEAFEELKRGGVDMMSAAIVTEERKSEMSFTEPYIEMATAIVIHRDAEYVGDMSDLNGKTLGLVEGDFVNFVMNDYPEIKIEIVSSEVEGLEKLQERAVDAFIAPIAVANFEIANRSMTDLIIAASAPYDLKLTMAVSLEMQPLVSILNKTFASMSVRERSIIANTWLKSYTVTGIRLVDVFKWLVPVVLTILVFVIFVVTQSNKKLNLVVKKNQTLAKRIVAIQEEERKLLSRDLHDEIGQNLTALRFHINAAQGLNQVDDLKDMIDTIDDIASSTYNASYELMHWLRPIALDDHGVEYALSNQVIVNLLKEANIDYHKTVIGDLSQLDKEISTNLYRIVQECITNAARHSEAKNLWLDIDMHDNELHVLIRDDGNGFDLETSEETREGLGINGIKDRLSALGGKYTLYSDNFGTRYNLTIPV